MFPFEKGISEAILNFSTNAVFLKPLLAFFGEVFPYLIVLYFLVKLFRIKSLKLRYNYIFVSILSLVISRGLITEVIRFFFGVVRPFVELGMKPIIAQANTPSFPSGHMAFLVPISLILLKMDRRSGRIVSVLTLVVGISRVFLGVHWVSDILGGIIVGAIGFYAALALLPKKLKEEGV